MITMMTITTTITIDHMTMMKLEVPRREMVKVDIIIIITTEREARTKQQEMKWTKAKVGYA